MQINFHKIEEALVTTVKVLANDLEDFILPFVKQFEGEAEALALTLAEQELAKLGSAPITLDAMATAAKDVMAAAQAQGKTILETIAMSAVSAAAAKLGIIAASAAAANKSNSISNVQASS